MTKTIRRSNSRYVIETLLMMTLCLAFCEIGRSEETSIEKPTVDPPAKKLRVVVLGAHPDDPEAGAGALISALTSAGHEAFVGYAAVYREGRQIDGLPEAEVRRKEAEEACAVMRATPKFFPYSAGKLFPDESTVGVVRKWLEEVNPDIVLTHWPLDTHPDHHAISSIVWQCYQHDRGWNLYYFEVVTGLQTLNYHPTLYLDIEPMLSAKERAVFCHKSQKPAAPNFWMNHEQMHFNRGKECGRRFAEAYVLVEAKPGSALLPVQFLPSLSQRMESAEAEH